ncbi:MAG: EamA family transporter [Methanobacteriaceae archaeon]|nr:EamA family transporter [Methanobacteriaceae archaeon]
MVWFIFAGFTALFESLTDVVSKKNLKWGDEYIISFLIRFITFLFLLPLIIFIGIPKIGPNFCMALIIGGSLNIITTLLYMKALKYSELSISVPMLAFTPLFLLITSPIILGEFPSFIGLIGIFLIITGSYVLNIQQWKEGYLEPFKCLLREKGPKLMLLVAFIWSITANFDKVGLINSSPIFWVVVMNFFIAVFTLPLMIGSYQKNPRSTNLKKRNMILMGFFSALTSIFQIYAISLTLVPYVIAVKRTSSVLGVLWGKLIFKEKRIKEKLVGATIMVIGVFIIMVS